MNDSAYAKIIRSHLTDIFQDSPMVLSSYPGVETTTEGLCFRAFGMDGILSPDGVFLDGQPQWGPQGIILSLLARHAVTDAPMETPWRAFRELPDSAPYIGAFRAHCEQLLVPHVPTLHQHRESIMASLPGRLPEQDGPGDWAVIVEPLPKIALCYHVYLPDDEFPANVTCLFSNNADRFLPTDALADVGEYMSRALITGWS